MTIVKNCCFHWDTRKGCIFIGYFTGGLSCICCMGSVIRLLLGLPLVIQNDDMQGQFPFNPLFFVFLAFYFGVHTIASLSLVPAVKECQELFMIPSIVVNVVDMLLDSIALIVVSVEVGKRDAFQNIYIGAMVLSVLLLPVLVYTLLVIISHFEVLFRRSDEVPLSSPSHNKKCLLSKLELTDSSETTIGPTTV